MQKYSIFSALILGAVVVACNNKHYDPGSVTPNTPANEPAGAYTMASAMAAVVPQPKTVSLNASTGGSFRGNSGTRYVFPPNAFRTAAGATVTGTVIVTATEYLKESDMLFSGVFPVSGTEPLLSGGELNIEATQGGQKLQMAPGAQFTANMPMAGVNADSMQLFIAEPVGAGGNVNWVKAGGGSWGGGAVFSVGDTIGLTSSTITYCNADRFMTWPINYQSFDIVINSGGRSYSEDSITISTLYDNYNGAWPLYRRDTSTNHTYHEDHVPDIPVHFVAFAVIKGNFYGGITGATPVTGGSYTIELKKTTPAEFKARVDAL